MCRLGADVAIAQHDVFLTGQPFQTHWTAGVDFIRGNPDLSTQPVLEPIANRVEAFTITELESTALRNRIALL